MRIFSFAILLAISIAFLSCSNGPMLESGIKQGYYEEELYDIAPPNKDISSDEVELYCKDMSYEESIECVAGLNDKKQEDYKTWQNKKSEPPKQVKKPVQKKQTKRTTQTKQTKKTTQTKKKK
ncbi:MAG: hypothetical protein LBC75_04390 [Fibromonadaceae bacterium]|nr:hypothetical protein [Fibromonadaceae bacterium]